MNLPFIREDRMTDEILPARLVRAFGGKTTIGDTMGGDFIEKLKDGESATMTIGSFSKGGD